MIAQLNDPQAESQLNAAPPHTIDRHYPPLRYARAKDFTNPYGFMTT